jgi:hypothetical protein
MAKKIFGAKTSAPSGGWADLPVSRGEGEAAQQRRPTKPAKPSSLLDTRVVYCGDNLEQLAKLPAACVDLIYIDPPFNSNRNYDGGQSGTDFWGETKEKRAFEDRHENTRAYIDYMRPRCVQLARVLKKTGSFYYHCDWHASHYVKVMLDQILGGVIETTKYAEYAKCFLEIRSCISRGSRSISLSMYAKIQFSHG